MSFAELAAHAASSVASIVSSPKALVAYLAGSVGVVLFIVGAFMRTMIPLRWVAVASNVALLVFGVLQPSVTTLIIAGTLLPLNLYRAAEMMRLTRRVEEAVGSSDLSGVWLKPYMTSRHLRAGQTLFRKGDLADHLYCLAEGRIELVEIGVVMGPGKLFGEIAFFAPDRRRTHTARCVEDCTVLMIDETTVKQLYYQNPSFGFHLIGLVAGRLSADIERIERKAASNEHPLSSEVITAPE